MSLLLVFRQQLREANRTRELPGIVLLFVLIYGLLGLYHGAIYADAGNDTTDFLLFPWMVSLLLVPMVGLLLGNNLVSGPREDGRLRLVFGQPVSRVAFFLGGYLASALVLVLAVAAGGLTMIAAIAALGTAVDVGAILTFVGLSILVGLAFTGIAVSISAFARTTDWTAFAMFAAFLVFVIVWRLVPSGVVFVANGFEWPASDPAWLDPAEGLSPSVAYDFLLAELTDVDVLLGSASQVTEPALYLGLLLLWTVLLPAASLWRFTATDL